MSSYKLLNIVMENSEADNWDDAVAEWRITDWCEDESQAHWCEAYNKSGL